MDIFVCEISVFLKHLFHESQVIYHCWARISGSIPMLIQSHESRTVPDSGRVIRTVAASGRVSRTVADSGDRVRTTADIRSLVTNHCWSRITDHNTITNLKSQVMYHCWPRPAGHLPLLVLCHGHKMFGTAALDEKKNKPVYEDWAC